MRLVLKMKCIYKILNIILDLIFPPACGFCGELCNNFLCKKCEQKFEQVKNSDVIDCKNDPVFFDEHFYLFRYKNDIREYIINYKFKEKSYLYKSFSEIFIKDETFINQFIKKYDIIISVRVFLCNILSNYFLKMFGQFGT